MKSLFFNVTKAEKKTINLYERLRCGSFNVYQYTNERLNVDFFHVLNFRMKFLHIREST